MKALQDYKEEYDNLSEKKNLSGKEALEAVKQNGYALQYVTKQTEEMALEAVKQNGDALQYVTKQTEEIALEAVKQYGDALQYVTEQTEEIALEAVKENDYALQYVDSGLFKDDEIIEVNGVKYKRMDN